MSQLYSAPNYVIHAWAVGRLANYWMAGVLFSLLSILFTLTFKMDPVKVDFDANLHQQVPEVIAKMRLYAFTPPIITAILCFIAICFFPLGRKRMEEIRAALDASRAAAKA